ncbi:MAG: bifunctional 5,10-methylene-tetrahydrofolate dehydrogenase/5,10-methylene-tetrahydrofolate cyclohydrolase [Gemmatimonadaceae bacterium]|nr:bifunctional 5,10-methylene-tetrahydrofolate dehydrogenase/5,10-methylene-tetrahydrofolate cyclohydrolase [Gemmatimonadaceae bacterium]
MPAELIDGVAIARSIREEVARDAAALAIQGITPGLSVILVGDDPASSVYVGAKNKACDAAGMRGSTIRLPADTSQRVLLELIEDLNRDDEVHGILVQLPLPGHIDTGAVVLAIDPAKDVDGFHPVNAGKLMAGERDGFVPCTPAGIQELLRRTGVVTDGAECVVVGRSNIVGKPIAALMSRDTAGGNSTVAVCHRHTRDLGMHTRRAEILIVAAGRPQLVTGDMIRPGAVVIDVGVNRVTDSSAKNGYRLVGDVDFDAASAVASKITPVPGGVGPMTIAMLLANTIRAATAVAARTAHRASVPHPAGK